MIYHIKEIDTYVDLTKLCTVTGIVLGTDGSIRNIGIRRFFINVAGYVHEVQCNTVAETVQARNDLISAWMKKEQE